MWNRVVLLVAGVACGWNLANYLTVPDSQSGRPLAFTVIATVVGLGYSVLLGIQAGAAAAALLAFALSALAAYAGNARQMSKVEEPLPRPRPRPSDAADPRPAVVLVAEGEPERYDGPGEWSGRLAARAVVGRRVAGWFVRPWIYARIRRAYRHMAPEDTGAGLLSRLAQELEARLGGEYRVRAAFLHTNPSLASALLHATEEGARAVILLPVGVPGERLDLLREQVGAACIREVGVEVAYALPGEGLAPLEEQMRSRLDVLTRGMVPPPPDHLPEALDALVAAVRDQAERRDRR